MKALLLIMFLTLSGCNWTIKRITEASTDGPYVFYRDGKLIVKSLRKSNDEINVRVDTFLNRSTANLMCYVDESTDSFPILLKDTLLTEPSRYDLPERIFAISDIEGNYKAFKNILVGAGVIDTQNNWTFKDGHVVLVGDFFDRGTSVTETLWLIYKLEGEAEKAGGKVHFILGNHEMMNMYGNLKYLEDKYLKNAKLIDEKYKDFYWTESELGRWLRTKNIAEQIGTILFVHGGISPEIAQSGLSLEKLNTIARANIGTYPDKLTDADAKLVYDTQYGPFWYRGMAKGELQQENVDRILQYAQCEKMVIGHTIMEEITPLYGNKVIAIDLHHTDNFDDGFMKGLWIEDGRFFEIDDKGMKKQLF